MGQVVSLNYITDPIQIACLTDLNSLMGNFEIHSSLLRMSTVVIKQLINQYCFGQTKFLRKKKVLVTMLRRKMAVCLFFCFLFFRATD